MTLFEKDIAKLLAPLEVWCEDQAHLNEGLFRPSLMMVLSELNSIYQWNEKTCIEKLSTSTSDFPIQLRNNITVWCEVCDY